LHDLDGSSASTLSCSDFVRHPSSTGGRRQHLGLRLDTHGRLASTVE
jgi:hypothetical protein